MASDIDILCALGGHTLTAEQKDVVAHMNNSMLVMANPGTGKTTTLRYGLVAASRLFNIDSRRILCMSFTNDATIEIKEKYKELCDKMGIYPGVNFSTFHSFCYSILRRCNPEITIDTTIDLFDMVNNIVNMMGLNIPLVNIKQIVACVKYTTTRCITDENSLMQLSLFKKLLELGITYEDYIKILDSIFNTKMFKGRIERGDIPLYAINGFVNNRSVVDEFNSKYDLVVVDEFQDLNFIYMIILSNMAKKLIGVGDIKQQIYRFNGSDDNIVDIFNKAYPNAYHTELKQSFRCSDKIAEFASRIIKYNNYEGFDGFKGVGTPGYVNVVNYRDFYSKFDEIVKNIEATEDWYNYMFLYRYQFSGFALIHKMFLKKIPINIKDYTPIYNTAIFKDINLLYKCTLSDDLGLWQEMYSKTVFGSAGEPKIIKDAKKQNTSVLNAKSMISDAERKFLSKIIELRTIFNTYKIEDYIANFIPFFTAYWKDKFYLDKFQYEPDVYFRMLTSIYRGCKWSDVIDIEDRKIAFINQSINLNYGIRFKTLHSAKGLEAENVFILDYDSTAIPNASRFSNLLNTGNISEISDMIRDERCLLFVGATRAKNNLLCVYNMEPTLFNNATIGRNDFQEWDSARVKIIRDSIIVNSKEIKVRSN